MKLRLTNHDLLSGYFNLSPLFKENELGIQGAKVNFFELKEVEQYIENSSCKEIIAESVLDYCPYNHGGDFISYFVKKLRKGGKLVIGGTDSLVLAKNYVNGQLTHEEFNVLAYGTQETVFDIKRGLFTIREIDKFINELNLTVLKVNLDNISFSFECMRM